MSKKPGKSPKSAAEAKKAAARAVGKLKALQSSLETKKAEAAPAGKLKFPPKRVLVFGGGAAAVIILVLLIFYVAQHKDAPPGASPQATALSPASVPERPGATQPVVSGDDRKDFPAIRTIRFEPPQPTRRDTLRAEILTDSPDPGRITYAYVWKINDRIVEKAQGAALDLSSLAINKMDLITVSVTPYDGARKGFSLESPVVAVHSIPPTLDVNMPRQARKAGEPLEMQLFSRHPDSDGVTFSLAAPIVPGMSIDAHSGKITWIIQPDQQGTIRFGAAVEDTEKTRVVRLFDVNVEITTVATVPAGIAERRSSD